jgi:hypothetical protein
MVVKAGGAGEPLGLHHNLLASVSIDQELRNCVYYNRFQLFRDESNSLLTQEPSTDKRAVGFRRRLLYKRSAQARL